MMCRDEALGAIAILGLTRRIRESGLRRDPPSGALSAVPARGPQSSCNNAPITGPAVGSACYRFRCPSRKQAISPIPYRAEPA